jgi:hypothetical protein
VVKWAQLFVLLISMCQWLVIWRAAFCILPSSAKLQLQLAELALFSSKPAAHPPVRNNSEIAGDQLENRYYNCRISFWVKINWKMTSILFQIEDNLKFVRKWKKTSILLQNEDDLNFLVIGRWSQLITMAGQVLLNWKTTSTLK